jgi:hypothetical protein
MIIVTPRYYQWQWPKFETRDPVHARAGNGALGQGKLAVAAAEEGQETEQVESGG